MSTLEKILTALLAALLLFIVFFSMHEIGEPRGPFGGERSEFDRSFGSNLRIGPFINIASEHSSGGPEANCETLQPVIVAALHDIKVDLEELRIIESSPDSFEIDQPTLDLFCNREASLTLADGRGWQLLLDKVPFTRVVPQNAPQDGGSEVRINATVIPLGGTPPGTPTATADVVIPDRYLEATSSLAQ